MHTLNDAICFESNKIYSDSLRHVFAKAKTLSPFCYFKFEVIKILVVLHFVAVPLLLSITALQCSCTWKAKVSPRKMCCVGKVVL